MSRKPRRRKSQDDCDHHRHCDNRIDYRNELAQPIFRRLTWGDGQAPALAGAALLTGWMVMSQSGAAQKDSIINNWRSENCWLKRTTAWQTSAPWPCNLSAVPGCLPTLRMPTPPGLSDLTWSLPRALARSMSTAGSWAPLTSGSRCARLCGTCRSPWKSPGRRSGMWPRRPSMSPAVCARIWSLPGMRSRLSSVIMTHRARCLGWRCSAIRVSLSRSRRSRSLRPGSGTDLGKRSMHRCQPDLDSVLAVTAAPYSREAGLKKWPYEGA